MLYNLKKKGPQFESALKSWEAELNLFKLQNLINKTWTIKLVFIANINKEGRRVRALHVNFFFFFFFCTPSPQVLGKINLFKLQLPHL